MKRRTLAIVVALLAAVGAQAQILVSAAASLTDVLTALGPLAEQSIRARVMFNFGGSGALRHQIEEGAPVDLFLSASAEDMDLLERRGLVLRGTRRDLLSNRIVLIAGPAAADAAPASTVDELRSLLMRAGLLAIGNPDTVPAGRYAVRALTTYGLYPMVREKLALGGNVREVFQYVQNGSAPLGIVFRTDVLAEPPGSVRQIFLFPEESTGPVLYPMAVVSASRNREKALGMIDFLVGKAAGEAFRAAGFIVK